MDFFKVFVMGPKRENGGNRPRNNHHRNRNNQNNMAKMPVVERQRIFSECSEDLCSVCWNEVKIFAFGWCNHPVCYVCLTKTRVLLSTQDCSICRQEMPLVIFSRNRTEFKDLSDQILPKDKRHQICFEDDNVKKSFEELLLHQCPICPSKPIFATFKKLDTHLRREHERFYCELCADNLKVQFD